MAKKKDRGLVKGNLERISSKVFDFYHDEITKLVRRQHGVYALYKKNRLYYVGLAKNLRGRVKHHLRDRHASKWDSFSLYLIHNVNYLRELESLLVHITKPKGNIARGHFARSENLLKDLGSMMAQRDRNRREEMLAGGIRYKASNKKKHGRKRARGKSKDPVLQGMFSKGTELRKEFLGKMHKARVDAAGRVRFKGKVFNSPSHAAWAVTGRPTNGWSFWSFKDKDGTWKKLDVLRAR
ncbi:MAG: DUF2924 domain-containing protein [Ignavibacteriales bacterium]|nr:DUF2924 domain-containing protein [Ignavibacteriales bacterium]